MLDFWGLHIFTFFYPPHVATLLPGAAHRSKTWIGRPETVGPTRREWGSLNPFTFFVYWGWNFPHSLRASQLLIWWYGCWTKNMGENPPKWMVKIMEHPIKITMIWGVFSLFLVQHPYISNPSNFWSTSNLQHFRFGNCHIDLVYVLVLILFWNWCNPLSF